MAYFIAFETFWDVLVIKTWLLNELQSLSKIEFFNEFIFEILGSESRWLENILTVLEVVSF